jgi:hypothetical protein
MAAVVIAAEDDIEGAPKESELPPTVAPGSARFTVSDEDKSLAPGQVPFEADETPVEDEREDYADIEPEVYRNLRPTGKAIARILDQAMYPEPEEEPIYYWDEEYEGDAEELTTAQIAFHNAHWAGYRTMKGAETVGEFFATFLGVNQSRYQWVIDAKQRDDERAEQEELENKQRRWLIAQAKLRRASMEAQKEADMEGGGDNEMMDGNDTKPEPEE